ncbi:MAG: 50S ribosomal protein L11 methyltransferase [Acidobacteria bacterium]|nr:50S ribosomal protein L11 methyltransferase [Acidobacteriota bacterium]
MVEEESSLRGNHLISLSQAAVTNPITAGANTSKAERLSDLVARLVSMGEAHLDNKQFVSALDCFESALYIDPENHQAQLGRSNAICTIIPRWHFEMLNDEQRNAAFEKALAKVVTADSLVLDIGSGTGLLAMMAARARAGKTISCEMVAPLAELAREVVARNGFAGKIQIMGKKSTDLVVGSDMPQRANLLVTETVDCGLLGEGIVPSIAHARANLLTEDALIIPRSASVYAMLVESKRLRGLNSVDRCAGFDLGLMRQYATPHYFPVRLAAFAYEALTGPFEVFRFDFARELILPSRKTISVPVTRDGTCHAVVFWFHMQLDEEISISNEPGSTTHWEQAIQCLKHEMTVRAGDVLQIEAGHDCCSIGFDQPTNVSAGAAHANR